MFVGGTEFIVEQNKNFYLLYEKIQGLLLAAAFFEAHLLTAADDTSTGFGIA